MRRLPIALLAGWLTACGSGGSGGGGPGPIAPPTTIHREEIRIVEPWAGIDDAGVGYVVWSNDANVGFLARHVPGEGWTATETIPSTVTWGSTVTWTGLAVDEAGVLYAADFSSAAGQIALWSYQAAAGWQQLAPLATPRGGSLELLAAARGVAVVWVHAETSFFEEIWGARYHPDSGWSVPAVVNHAPPPTTNRDIGSASAAADPDGNVAVIWREQTSAATSLLAANLPAGGSWSEPRVLQAASAVGGDVAMSAGGRGLAAWGDQGMLIASRLDPQGGWENPAPAIAAGLDQMKVSLDDLGRAFVTWMELSDDPTARLIGFDVLRAASQDAGGGWRSVPVPDRHPLSPNVPASLNVFYATSTLVGSDGRGALAATSGSGREMYLVPYRYGGAGGTARVLDVTDDVVKEQGLPVDGVTVAFGRPHLVANRAGQAIMIWTMLRMGGPGLLRVTAFDL